MNRSLASAVVVLVVMIGLAVDAHAGGKETMVGLKQMTVIAGPPLPATTFRVVQGGDRIEDNDEVYQWDPGTGRYQAVLGMAYGWIELNPIGDGDGGFQYQPPGGAAGTAGAYAHIGS